MNWTITYTAMPVPPPPEDVRDTAGPYEGEAPIINYEQDDADAQGDA